MFSSSADKLEFGLRIDGPVQKNQKKYSSETSCSDNSDNELKVQGENLDWVCWSK